ncbi:hypothetical protein [Actinomycetospora chiangmaiensis]|uniref:hypothetical protein n=1 Tax=Actinomycetospora chiangmaiensis TaxID=402650 RepID=UPI000476CF42|nr:hypothetical protein [Actinomycetospora chiangmaiensis]
MTRSRQGRSGEAGEPAGLPLWAQRHLDESGYTPAVTTSHRRGDARSRTESPLRGWGLAILSVAAAVTAVPLAVNAVANDRSSDPLPTVDTYTAGSPQALDGGQGGATRRGPSDVTGDPATAGILTVPGPGAPPAAPPAPVVPAPLPAAVVRPTQPAVPTLITPRAATPTTAPTTKPTTTTTGAGDGQGRSGTPTGTTKPTSGSKSAPSGGNDGGGGQKGLVPQVADTAGKTVNGLGKAVGGLL